MMSDHMRNLDFHHSLEDGNSSRVQGKKEKRINECEDVTIEVTLSKQRRKIEKKKKKKEQALRDLWDDKANIHVIGIPEEDEKERTEKSVLNGENLLKFDKRHKPADLRDCVNLKQEILKENYTKKYHNQTSEN